MTVTGAHVIELGPACLFLSSVSSVLTSLVSPLTNNGLQRLITCFLLHTHREKAGNPAENTSKKSHKLSLIVSDSPYSKYISYIYIFDARVISCSD